MPHRKRGHGHKKPRGKAEESLPGADRQTSTSRISHKTASGSQSQHRQATSAAPAPVKHAQFEAGAKATASPATSAGAGAGRGAVPAATQKGSPKPMAETKLVTPSPAAPKGSPKDVPKTSASSTATSTAGAVKATDPAKAKTTPAQDTLKSSAITSSTSHTAKAGAKGGVSTDTKAKDTKPADTKVQREVGPPKSQAKAPALDIDPLDALAGTLPDESLRPTAPVYTGPEVTEAGLTTEEGVLVGERDDTLPEGYRKADLEKKAPAAKPEPKPTQKPLSTDAALDSLSAGFMSSAPPAPKKTETKVEDVAAIDALSAGFSNFAPPPPASTKSPAPPADKKAKVDKVSDDFSLMAGLSAPAPAPAPVLAPAGPKDASISLDALSALEDMLPTAEPVPESPKLRPEDIVTEEKTKKEKGVICGERDDTLPPDYRFTEEDLMKYPAPKPEPSMDPSDALDLLSGDFMTSSAAPAVQAPVITPSAPPQPISAPAPPPAAVRPATEGGMSLDALSALEDMLPTAEPVPESPKLRPEDIVTEDKTNKEKAVLCGERDDSLPPDYRFTEEDLKKYPAPKPEPSMDPSDALDLLSGDFMTSSAAPAVQAPVITPSAPPQPAASDFALDALAGDFVAPAVAPAAVQSSVCSAAERQLSSGTCDALDALSDTLMDTTPAPQPVPVAPKDIVKERTIEEEKLIKMGERDDTLPPEYRPSEDDLKAVPAVQPDVRPKQKSMDDTSALDLLSSDFSSSPIVPAVVPAAPVESSSLAPAPAPVLDALADSLIPQAVAEVKPKSKVSQGDTHITPEQESIEVNRSGKSKSKSKKHAAEDSSALDLLSDQLTTDVVSTSSTKKGGKR
ncbi:calpastatin isoform X5 [Engraulis encrasicolus]|uniref:calpastatin isoform X5 n=1 Tax=Engraulis encrasicolus TaxID=184585 RepID=UPI002FD14CFA